MPASLVVRNSTLALDSRPIQFPSASRGLLDDRNGTACCCGQATCASCCRNGLDSDRCCYRIGNLIKPQVVHYYCWWYAEDPEFGSSRSATAEFIMSGGPYEISQSAGVCAVSIRASGTWRSWLDNNQVRQFTDAEFVLRLGPSGGGWGMSFPAHPVNAANLWSPRGQVPPGSYGCDFADGDGEFSAVFPGYPNAVDVNAVLQVMVSDADPGECRWFPPNNCECLT